MKKKILNVILSFVLLITLIPMNIAKANESESVFIGLTSGYAYKPTTTFTVSEDVQSVFVVKENETPVKLAANNGIYNLDGLSGTIELQAYGIDPDNLIYSIVIQVNEEGLYIENYSDECRHGYDGKDEIVNKYNNGNPVYTFIKCLSNEKITEESFSEYDSKGNVIKDSRKETDAEGKVIDSIINYDAKGNMIKESRKETDAEGKVTESIINYEYDSKGNRIKESRKETDAEGTVIDSIINYDAKGNMIKESRKETDAEGKVTESIINYEYDSKGNVIKDSRKETDAEGKVIDSIINYDAKGNVIKASIKETDAEGKVTESIINYEYDSKGNRIKESRKETDAEGTVTEFIIDLDVNKNKLKEKITYFDSKGNVEIIYVHTCGKIGNNDVYISTDEYNGKGVLVSKTENKFNEQGDLIGSKETFYNPDGTVSTTIDYDYVNDVEYQVVKFESGNTLYITNTYNNSIIRELKDKDGKVIAISKEESNYAYIQFEDKVTFERKHSDNGYSAVKKDANGNIIYTIEGVDLEDKYVDIKKYANGITIKVEELYDSENDEFLIYR